MPTESPQGRPPRSASRCSRRTHIRAAVTAALLAALTATVVGTLRAGDNQGRLPAGYAVAWTLFAAAARTVRKVPARAAPGLVPAGSAAVAPAALATP
ncbi:hypothetical protein PV678_35950, partial [Streptomyces europaeiscabiei]|nr:hypothetical protein [Streptomyces europaeiscabiei]